MCIITIQITKTLPASQKPLSTPQIINPFQDNHCFDFYYYRLIFLFGGFMCLELSIIYSSVTAFLL